MAAGPEAAVVCGDVNIAPTDEDVFDPEAYVGQTHVTVREYWRRQWAEIDSSAEPTAISERPDGKVEVAVRLVARDETGKVLNDSIGRHVYDFRGDLIERMTIED